MLKQPKFNLEDLLYLMRRLRDPESGCPWDIKQNYRSITPSTIEEAYEVVDAIEREDYAHLKEELGDLLFQVVFYGQLAEEDAHFSFQDIVHELTNKLVRRHPHVFPDGTLESRRDSYQNPDHEQVNRSWEAIKQQERQQKGRQGVFDDVPGALPALTRAGKLQKRAAKLGFDWPNVMGVIDKIDEEIAELKQAFVQGDQDEASEELGDLMFTCVNLARHLGHDPESLVRQANSKFQRRFEMVESKMAASEKELTPAELDAFWELAKQQE